MEEKNNTPNKLDFISKFRAQYQVPKNVPNEMVEFFPSFEHAWAGWCMACPSQPTQSVGLTVDQCTDAVLHLIHGTHDLNWFDNNDGEGFSSDEHEFRHLREKLSAILARQTAPTPERKVLANIVGEVSHTVGGDCVFFVEKTDAIRVLKRGDRLSIVARSAPTLDSAQQGEPLTYTVDGVVMSQLEYIDYLHGQLDEARTAANVRKVVEVAESTNPAVELLKEKYAKQGEDEPPHHPPHEGNK